MNNVTKINPGAINELISILDKHEGRNIFLVTGKNSFSVSGAKKHLERILKHYSITSFNDFNVNPIDKDLIKGVKLFRKNHCNLIISVGGGSVIDMAKLIKFFQSSSSINKISRENFEKEITENTIHICIPTTSGSGSEATHFAVLYIEGIKNSIANPKLIPDYVLIDTNFHQSQTPFQKAVSGIDALAQAIESAWSNKSSDESNGYSMKAIKNIWNYLPHAINNNSEVANLKMAEGANLAGKAINISKTTGPHALSYAFTSLFGIPHGQAVLLSLPYFFEYNYNVTKQDLNDSRGLNYVKVRILEICSLLGISRIGDTKETLSLFLKSIGINTNIKIGHLDKSYAIIRIKKLINFERMNNNPRIVNDLFIDEILNKILI